MATIGCAGGPGGRGGWEDGPALVVDAVVVVVVEGGGLMVGLCVGVSSSSVDRRASAAYEGHEDDAVMYMSPPSTGFHIVGMVKNDAWGATPPLGGHWSMLPQKLFDTLRCF